MAMTDQITYVALVQQGMVLDQRALATGTDQQELQALARSEAAVLNAGASMTVAYTAVVLEIPSA